MNSIVSCFPLIKLVRHLYLDDFHTFFDKLYISLSHSLVESLRKVAICDPCPLNIMEPMAQKNNILTAPSIPPTLLGTNIGFTPISRSLPKSISGISGSRRPASLSLPLESMIISTCDPLITMCRCGGVVACWSSMLEVRGSTPPGAGRMTSWDDLASDMGRVGSLIWDELVGRVGSGTRCR